MRSFIQAVFGIVCFLVVAGLVLGFFFQIVSEILKWLGSVRDSLFGSSDAQVKEPAVPEPTPRSALRPVPTLVPPPAPKVVPKPVPKPTPITSSPSRLRLDDLLPPAIKEPSSPSVEQIELLDWINLREAGIGLLAAMLRLCEVDENAKFDKVYSWVGSLSPSNVKSPGNDAVSKRLRDSFFSQYNRRPSPYVLIPLVAASADHRFKHDIAALAHMVSGDEDVGSVVRSIYGQICSEFSIYVYGNPVREIEPPKPKVLPPSTHPAREVDLPLIQVESKGVVDDPIALTGARVRLLTLLSTPSTQLCRVLKAKRLVIPFPVVIPAPVKVERKFALQIQPIIEDSVAKGVEVMATGSVDAAGYGTKEFTYWIWDVTRGDETIFRKAMPDIDEVTDAAVDKVIWPNDTYDYLAWNRVACIYFNRSQPPVGGNRLLVVAGRLVPLGYSGADWAGISTRSDSLGVKIGSLGYMKIGEIRARQVEEEFEPLKRVFALAIGLSMMMATNTTHAQDKVFKRLVADLKDRCVFKANAVHAKDTFERMLVSSKKRRLSYWINQVDGMTLSADYRLKSLLVDALGRLIDGRKVRSTEAIALYNHCLEAFEFGHLPRKA